MTRTRIALALVALLATPGLAHADRILRYGYPQETTLVFTPSGHVLAVPSVTGGAGTGSIGAPLHGTVCSKGTIAELPLERRHLYTDGAAVGLPGQRCLTFDQQ